MKQKTLYGIRYVNKKWAGPSLVCYRVPGKKTNDSKIVAFFTNCMKQDRSLERDTRYNMNIPYCLNLSFQVF